MIFVTVGTHEQPFNRLVKAIDDLVENGTIKLAGPPCVIIIRASLLYFCISSQEIRL